MTCHICGKNKPDLYHNRNRRGYVLDDGRIMPAYNRICGDCIVAEYPETCVGHGGPPLSPNGRLWVPVRRPS